MDIQKRGNYPIKSIAVLLMVIGLFVGASSTDARQVGQFSKFKLTYNGGEKYTRYLTKSVTNRAGVLNLSNDTGSAWITGHMRNSNGKSRGSVQVQRGKRATFSNTGTANYLYRMGLSKTNPGTVTIKGSWSPDTH
ncbi:MAG TPA: hypothetical protein VF095_05310 [Bacillota bacterium]